MGRRLLGRGIANGGNVPLPVGRGVLTAPSPVRIERPTGALRTDAPYHPKVLSGRVAVQF